MILTMGAASPLDILKAYADVATTKAPATAYVKSIGRASTLSAAQRAEIEANQGICNQAASAKARGSVAYPALAAKCVAARRANIMAGMYFVDAMSPDDEAYRTALTDAGEAAILRNPALAQERAQVPAAMQRGFTIAQGIRSGSMDPAFPSWVAAGLSGVPGFFEALNAPLTQANRPDEDALDSIPRPVLIGGGVALALGLGLLAYKLTR